MAGEGTEVEIILLFVGIILIAAGVAIISHEVHARRGTQSVTAQVVGFSRGTAKNPNKESFHSVAEYIGPNGGKYYVEGSVGSSVPLHAIGDSVTVLVRPTEPQSAVLKSSLSYVLGGVLAGMGLVCAGIFWMTFRLNTFSVMVASAVIALIGFKIKKAWREKPMSLGTWQDYKKQIFSPRVFTSEKKDEIAWADPASITTVIQRHRTANRFAIPVLFVLGIGLLFWCYYSYQKTETFLVKADRAEGRVIDLKERNSSDGESTYAAVVEYRLQGQRYEFVDSFSSSPAQYHTGQTVGVLYNREDPREARIDLGRWNHWATVLLGFLGGSFTLLGLFSLRKRRR